MVSKVEAILLIYMLSHEIEAIFNNHPKFRWSNYK